MIRCNDGDIADMIMKLYDAIISVKSDKCDVEIKRIGRRKETDEGVVIKAKIVLHDKV